MKDKDGGSIPVLLLKTRSTPNDGYEEQLSLESDDFHFTPTFVPVLEHKLINEGMDSVQNLVQHRQIGREKYSKYGGMIFTSQRAVEAFAKLVVEGKESGAPDWPYLQDVPIYTVGPATSRALRFIPQSPPLQIFGSECGNGQALAHYMLDHYEKWYEDRHIKPPLLFLVGEQRRDIIPKTLMNSNLTPERRIQVDELIVYGTGVMESFEDDFTNILHKTQESKVRWVIVFSPTGCEAMLRAMNMLDLNGKVKKNDNSAADHKTYIATIGPTTRDYLWETFGYEPDVCAMQPSPGGVEAAIKNYLQGRL